VLCFRQSQPYKALVYLRADFVCLDRWIELERAPEIFRTRFMMNHARIIEYLDILNIERLRVAS